MTRWFEIANLSAAYTSSSVVLRDVSLYVEPGEVVSVIGRNGAGKSTLMNAICGLVPIVTGDISFDGERIDGCFTREIVAKGIAQVPEGRQLFADMRVDDNLRLGGYLRPASQIAESLNRVYAQFPILQQRAHQRAGSLSGGEQQMVAIGRALMSEPRLLLLDEPSIGLAPRIVDDVGERILALADSGCGVILVEQNSELALSVSSRAYVLELGSVVVAEDSKTLRDKPEITRAYLSV